MQPKDIFPAETILGLNLSYSHLALPHYSKRTRLLSASLELALRYANDLTFL